MNQIPELICPSRNANNHDLLIELFKEEGDENMAELLLSEEDELLAEIAQIPA